MQKNNPALFSEKELNNILNRSFLESHLAKPKYEKITEAIAAHALGVKAVSIPTQQSFIKKLISKISLQVFLICSILLGGGITGVIFLYKNSEHSGKINATHPDTYEQTAGSSNSEKYIEQKNNSKKSNTATPGKAVSQKTLTENTLNMQTADHDSTTVNLSIQRPEPIYFEDPAILLSKRIDSTSERTKTTDTRSLKNDTAKKRRKAKGSFEYSIDKLK